MSTPTYDPHAEGPGEGERVQVLAVEHVAGTYEVRLVLGDGRLVRADWRDVVRVVGPAPGAEQQLAGREWIIRDNGCNTGWLCSIATPRETTS